jgi:hypothetical protein
MSSALCFKTLFRKLLALREKLSWKREGIMKIGIKVRNRNLGREGRGEHW